MEDVEKVEITGENLEYQEESPMPPLADSEPPQEEAEESENSIDYAALVKSDVAELACEFSELRGLNDITELENPLRYAALRDLGLTAAEAYLATTKNRHKSDNRSHLFGMPMVSSSPAGSMPERELEAAREIFTDISDAQIRKLYKKVTR